MIVQCDVSSGQFVAVYDGVDGREIWRTARQEVAAGAHLYFASELGDVYVVPVTTEFRVVATNRLDGLCLATPAVGAGTIYFRTTEKVVAVGK